MNSWPLFFRWFGVVVVVAIIIGAITIWWRDRQTRSVVRLVPTNATTAQVDHESTLDLTITTPETINAAEFFIHYDPSAVEVTDVSNQPSLFGLWILDAPKMIEPGKIWFAGGIPKPGFQGTGIIGRLTIKPKHAGRVTFSFEQTRLLRHDGVGTAVPLRLEPLTVTVKP